ncbi:MAG: hypothetical protein HY304_04260 [candidate division Zixibacteria bacterium]|nr:hypothetical protein [candidate division Zixibacteria bacterium]
MTTVTKSSVRSSIHRDAQSALPVEDTGAIASTIVGPGRPAYDSASSQYRMILNCSGPLPILATTKTQLREQTN